LVHQDLSEKFAFNLENAVAPRGHKGAKKTYKQLVRLGSFK